MSITNDIILEEYENRLDTYKKVSEIVLNEVSKIVKDLDIEYSSITSRIKKKESLLGKLDRKSNKYKSIDQLTDIVGTRVVAFFLSDVDKIAAKIISTFDIDYENSVDKRTNYKVDQFGYVSIHYIVKIPKSLYEDANNPLINEISSEIQLRTNLQHTWASIYHRTGYKSDIEIPKDISRQFSRLAGLLELADQEFQNIHDQIGQYRRSLDNFIKEGKFSEIELTGDAFKAYVDSGAFEPLNKHITSINNIEIEKCSINIFLKVFKNIGFETLKDLDDLVKNYSDMAYRLLVLQFSGTDIDIVTSITAPLSLSIVYLIDKGYGVIGIKMLLDEVYGVRKSNKKSAEHLYELGVTLGIVKNEK